MRIQIKRIERLVISCPFCGNREFEVGHLGPHSKIGQNFGPWFCDECGRSFLGKVNLADVEITEGSERKVKTQVTMQLRPENAPLTLLVDHFLILEKDETPDSSVAMENQRYLFEEHTCPTNWLGWVEEVISKNGEHDPHEAFTYVKTEVIK